MARYVRLYPSPTEEKHGNVLGFSSGISYAARDPELYKWLTDQGYNVTAESEEQTRSKIKLGGLAINTTGYLSAPGIPIPENTVSAGHMLIEPPLKDEDLRPLGELLRHLDAIDDGGLRRHLFIDNRVEEPRPYGFSLDSVIAWWG